MIGEPLHGDAAGFRHLALESCLSTNSKCLELASAGEVGNLWVTSVAQTGGRGSRGREWQSAKGNLFASLLLRSPCEQRLLGGLAFVAALSALTAINRIAGKDAGLQLKWPNDVLIRGKKCGGILLESISKGDETVVVIGSGINCNAHPPTTDYPATDLASEGIQTNADELFPALAEATAEYLELWDEGRNFSGIRERWIQHAAGLGQPVRVKIPNRPDASGTFTAVDEAGNIMLEKPDGQMLRISAADVFFN